MHKILNRSTVKLSHSTKSSIEQQISGQNKKKLHGGEAPEPNLTCNCREEPCPLQGQCNVKNIVYHATVKQSNMKDQSYYGLTSRKFIERYRLHKRSFRQEFLEKDTTLAEKIWELRRDNSEYSVNFEIFKITPSYMPGSPTCNLCLEEKYAILKNLRNSDRDQLISRAEIYSHCRHKVKFKFANVS